MTSAFASGTQRKAPRLLPLMLGELGIPSMNLTDRAGGDADGDRPELQRHDCDL
jgi:hypothetical protein